MEQPKKPPLSGFSCFRTSSSHVLESRLFSSSAWRLLLPQFLFPTCFFRLRLFLLIKMDTSQWPQGIGVVKVVEPSKGVQERKPRPQKEQAVNCPRCNSTNTKFCYYNNYSLSQPRYFCKTCRRYWTEGGSLRNVPVGGGSRKNKRSSNISSNNNSSSSTSSKKLTTPDLTIPKINEPHDLNFSNISEFMALPFISHDQNKSLHLMNPNTTTSFMPLSDTNTLYTSSSTSGLSNNLHDLKPTLNFSLDHHHGFDENNGYGNLQGAAAHQDISTGAKLFFPLDDLKTSVTTDPNDQHHQADQSNGFWNGMLGGGSSW